MRGGKRPGAGRKKASAARELEATGLTPRDVMLAAMRQLWALAQNNKNNRKLNEHYVRAAVAVEGPSSVHSSSNFEHCASIGRTANKAFRGGNHRWVANWVDPGKTRRDGIEVPPGEPPLRHILIGEELEMVLVADVLACGVMRSRSRRRGKHFALLLTSRPVVHPARLGWHWSSLHSEQQGLFRSAKGSGTAPHASIVPDPAARISAACHP
jgi:hypothetical protein